MYKKYDEETKKKIVSAVNKTRTGGGTWAEAYAAAQKEGYTSSLAALHKMAYKSTVAPKRLGRPKGTKTKSEDFLLPARSYNEIGVLVDNMANQRAAKILQDVFGEAMTRLKQPAVHGRS
jgi:hypothetical protein